MLQQSTKITDKPTSIIKQRKEQIKKKKKTCFTSITKDNKKEIKEHQSLQGK
jgi:hypothetical protein